MRTNGGNERKIDMEGSCRVLLGHSRQVLYPVDVMAVIPCSVNFGYCNGHGCYAYITLTNWYIPFAGELPHSRSGLITFIDT